MPNKTALIVIDVQIGIIEGPGIQRGPEVLSRIAELLTHARAAKIPVIYIQHDGPPGHRAEPNTRGWPIHPAIAPLAGESVLHKRASDSFFETELQATLARLGVDSLIIAGCMTEYCVDTTCRRAVTQGYDVKLVSDAHTTADTPALKATQIIAHHNELLDGFSAGGCSITVTPLSSLKL